MPPEFQRKAPQLHNTPYMMGPVLERLAMSFDIEPEDMARRLHQNAVRFFGLEA